MMPIGSPSRSSGAASDGATGGSTCRGVAGTPPPDRPRGRGCGSSAARRTARPSTDRSAIDGDDPQPIADASSYVCRLSASVGRTADLDRRRRRLRSAEPRGALDDRRRGPAAGRSARTR